MSNTGVTAGSILKGIPPYMDKRIKNEGYTPTTGGLSAPVAQWIECRSSKPSVESSNLSWGIVNNGICGGYCSCIRIPVGVSEQ